MNRRAFIAGLLATTFTLKADAPQRRPRHKMLAGVDVPPANGQPPRCMVVLLHGFGGNGESMRTVAKAWAKQMPDAVFVMPDAPDQCHENPNDPKSREWFATRALDPDQGQRAQQIRAVEPVLNDYIDAKLAQYGLPDSQLAIAGISQGAMMALQAGPRRRHACAAIVEYSGMLVDPAGLKQDRVTRPPLFAAHGDRDTVVPYAHLATVEKEFRAAGFAVETATYPVGHMVTPMGLQRGGAFIRRHFDANRNKPWLRRIFGL